MKLFICVVTFTTLTYSCFAAAELAFTAGAFRFNATDYYFPNFYEDAGYRGGLEVGGYYDDVFLPKDKKLRPFAEAGFAYSF
jgi:hypothetical protein